MKQAKTKAMYAFAALCLLPAITGCGGDADLIQVKGTVNYKGKPLESGYIIFVSGTSGQVTAEINNGVFEDVKTYAGGKGIKPGEYKVAIVSQDRSGKFRDALDPPSLIPKHYTDFSTSGLTANFSSGERKELEFNLD